MTGYARAQPLLVTDLSALGFNRPFFGGKDFFKKSGSLLYFAKYDEYGWELWRTDGTKDGTFRLTDIMKGYESSVRNIRGAVDLNGELFFTDEHGSKIWKTNGTVQGTVAVGELILGNIPMFATGMEKAGNNIVITALELGVFNTSICHLFVYSGATQQVTHLKAINNGYRFISSGAGNNHAYFGFFDAGGNGRYWISDGTSSGTKEVLSLPTFNDTRLIEVGNKLLIQTAGNTIATWDRETETSSGVITLGSSEHLLRMTTMTPTRVMIATDQNIWSSDGTMANTVIIAPNMAYGDSYDAGDKGYFIGRNPTTSDIFLFETDWTQAGTFNRAALGNSSFIGEEDKLLAVGDRVYTIAWPQNLDPKPAVVMNGNVQLIKDALPGSSFYSTASFASINNKVLFVSYWREYPSTYALMGMWTTDGTAAGTQPLLNSSQTTPDGLSGDFYSFKDEAWFIGPGISTPDLWRASPQGVITKHKEITEGASFLGILNNELYLTSQRKGPFKTDGQVVTALHPFNPTTVFLSYNWKDDFMTVGNKLVFPYLYQVSTPVHQSYGYEPWVTDGTEAGTHVLKNISPGGGYSLTFPYVTGRMKTLNSTTGVFAANDNSVGDELWKTDGTELGTQLLKDINPGTASSGITNMVALNGIVYFRAFNGTKSEVWKTDGTPGGTVAITNMDLGGSYSSTNLVVHGDHVYFTANDNNTGWRLYRLEGAQVAMVGQINTANSVNKVPTNFLSGGDWLYFSADGADRGQELWVTDGTGPGTRVIDFIPGPQGSFPKPLLVFNNQLLLSADGRFYHLLIQGATILYEKVSDLDPQYMHKVGSQIFFTAFSRDYGLELFRLPDVKFNQGFLFEIPDRKLADGDFTLPPTAPSGLPLSYTSPDPEVIINGRDVDVKSAGSVTITAIQAGNEIYNGVLTPDAFCINPDKPTVGIGVGNNLVASSANAGNQWYLNGNLILGANLQTYTVLQSGLYTVQSSIEGCVSEMSEAANVVFVGIEDAAADLSIYPNPASDKLVISWPSQSEVELSVMTTQGQEIEKVVFNDSYSLKVADYSTSVYILKLRTIHGVSFRKFIKH